MTVEPDRTLLRPGLQLVITGTVGRGRRPAQYYAGPGNRFWELLQGSGLVTERLDPDRADQLSGFGIGLTDLVIERMRRPGQEPEVIIHSASFERGIAAVRPSVVAFVSKAATTWYTRGVGARSPAGYGEVSWKVAGAPAFVLPGPSGANNGMPMSLRLALWTDLTDFLDHVGRRS